jgi:hypothetical protein
MNLTPDPLLGNPDLAKEFGVCVKTIERWERDPKIAPDLGAPMIINGRKYRTRSQIETFKQKRRAASRTLKATA